MNILEKALNQDMPIKAMENALPFTFDEIRSGLLEEIDPVEDSGTYEHVKGDWYFYIDYRAKNFHVEYACANIYYKGDEYISPWPASQFDMMVQPEEKEPPSGPDILDYSDYL